MASTTPEAMKTFISAIDTASLGLSALPSHKYDDEREYAEGVLDGMRLASIAAQDPELSPGEVLLRNDRYNSLDWPDLERDRLLGMLVGSLAVVGRLMEKENSDV